MKKLTNIQIIDAMFQARQDTFTWYQAKGAFTKQSDEVPYLAGFSNGFSHGWRAAVRYLKLHGALETK